MGEDVEVEEEVDVEDLLVEEAAVASHLVGVEGDVDSHPEEEEVVEVGLEDLASVGEEAAVEEEDAVEVEDSNKLSFRCLQIMQLIQSFISFRHRDAQIRCELEALNAAGDLPNVMGVLKVLILRLMSTSTTLNLAQYRGCLTK